MTQRRLNRLMQILQLKEQATRVAIGEWQIAKDNFTNHKNKHDQLVVYRREYVQQLNELGGDGCAAGRLRNRIHFIAQLDSALAQLTQQLAALAKQRAQCEKSYLQAKAQQDAVLKLIDRVKAHQQARENQMQQKDSDETAQKLWGSKSFVHSNQKNSD